MSQFGIETILIGSGWGVAVPPATIKPTDPKKEYLPVGPNRMMPRLPMALARFVDDLTRQVGWKAYEAMLTDPAVHSSYLSLKLGVLDGGMTLMPALESAGKKRKRQVPETRDNPGTVVKLTHEEQRSLDILEFCERSVARLEKFDDTLLQLLDAMAFGCKLAEPTFEVADAGQDKGKLVPSSVKVKPGWSWQFVVDGYLNVRGVLVFLPADGMFLVVGPDKFMVHTNLPMNNDPRGTSSLRAAYAAWNLKVQSIPQAYQYLVRWAQPGVDFEMAEGDVTPRIPVDDKGNEIPGLGPMDPVAYHTQNLIAYQGGSVFVHPHDSTLNLAEPKGKGEVFWAAFDWFDRQIVLAIECQTRATLEAMNGSKADSETSQDTKGLVIGYQRKSLAGTVRGFLKQLVTLNFGKDDAAQFTPTVTFGHSEHQDRPALWGAVATLNSSGYLGDSQKAELDAEVGLPVRDADADAKAAQARADAAMQPANEDEDTGDKPNPKNDGADTGPPKDDPAGGDGEKQRQVPNAP